MDYTKAARLQKLYNDTMEDYSRQLSEVHAKYKHTGLYRGQLPEYHAELSAIEVALSPVLQDIHTKLTEASLVTEDERQAFFKEYWKLAAKHHIQILDCGDYCVSNTEPCTAIYFDML